MTIQHGRAWRDSWTAAQPVDIGFAWAANTEGEFLPSQDGFAYRDLGLAEASGNALSVRRVRVVEPQAATRWRRLDLDFDFLYVLCGEAAVESSDGAQTPLDVGSTALHPRGSGYRFTNVSDDFEAVHVTAPGWDGDIAGAEPSLDPSATPIYTHEAPEAYERGDGPRSYFLYRDLHTAEATDGRIHFHVVRATEAGPGTGWHYHTMAQWFLIVAGSSVIRVEDRRRYQLGWGDAMCVGRGPNMRHNVTSFSADYGVLEMCIPAQYETVGVDEPANADTE